jgi:hypothetical protein
VGLRLWDLDSRPAYQPGAVDFIVKQPRCAALLRPGLGKTIVALTALLRLGAKRTIIAAPAQVVESGVWSQEAAAWEHTRHLHVVELCGKPAERELEMLLGGDITVVSYDLLGWLTDRIREKLHVRNNYFDAAIYDELSKMKHPGTKRFKRMRAWAQDIPVRIGLTGSPLGNSWADIWGEMFITAGEAALGDTQEKFLDTYFKQVFHAARSTRRGRYGRTGRPTRSSAASSPTPSPSPSASPSPSSPRSCTRRCG